MRSRRSAGAAAALLVATLGAVSASARQDAASSTPITTTEIANALATVRRDPNLGGETSIKMLRWRERRQQGASRGLGWFSWVAGLVGWAMQSARYLMWAAIVFLVAWIGVYLARAIQARRSGDAADAFVPPTHVRDLDIRPQSLPANIGQAARRLWDQGDHRAALSLLYRGLLSRLTHVHRVPITDSSTEGDCLALLSGRPVAPKTGDYCARLVGAWQAFVYGGTAAADQTIYSLCDEFAGALDRAAARPITDGGAS